MLLPRRTALLALPLAAAGPAQSILDMRAWCQGRALGRPLSAEREAALIQAARAARAARAAGGGR